MPNPENLIPAKPGEVRNPTGRNQYTYRAEAEKHLDEWCKLYGQELVDTIANAAKAGKPWAAKLILDRVLPAVQHHDVKSSGPDLAGLGDALASLAKSKRSNGRDRDADAGSNGGGA
jgi:hypothetical protein